MIPSPKVIRGGIALAGRAPLGLLRPLARSIGVLAALVAGARRRTLYANAAMLANGPQGSRPLSFATRTMANLCEAALDLFRIPSAGREEIRSWVQCEGQENLTAAASLGRGVIVATAHLGPYELGAAFLSLSGLSVHAMVEDIDSDTNESLALYRSATGVKLVSRNSGVRQLYRLLKSGQVILLAADRVIGDAVSTVVIPFGRGVREIPSGPATLSLATGAPVVVGSIVRRENLSGGARYLCRIEAPLAAYVGESAEDFARRIGDRLSAAVSQDPDQWYVFKPDWLPRDRSSSSGSHALTRD